MGRGTVPKWSRRREGALEFELACIWRAREGARATMHVAEISLEVRHIVIIFRVSPRVLCSSSPRFLCSMKTALE